MQVPNAGFHYFQNDAIGTPQRLVNKSGIVTWSANYSAFGEPSISVNSVTNPIRFPGQYQDAESGFYQNYFRDYDPALGAYTNHDPYGVLVTGLNRYQYVGGNPVSLTDPTGEIAPVIGVLIRFAIFIITDIYTGGSFSSCFDQLFNGCTPENVGSCRQAALDAILSLGTGGLGKYRSISGSPVILKAQKYGRRVKDVSKAPQKLLPSPRDYFLNKAKDPQLRDAINNLYRPKARLGNGSSMDAYRIEGTHLEKIVGRRRQLEKVSKNPLLNRGDRKIVEELLADIDDALASR